MSLYAVKQSFYDQIFFSIKSIIVVNKNKKLLNMTMSTLSLS